MKKIIIALMALGLSLSAFVATTSTSKITALPTDVSESCSPGTCHTHSDGVYWCH